MDPKKIIDAEDLIKNFWEDWHQNMKDKPGFEDIKYSVEDVYKLLEAQKLITWQAAIEHCVSLLNHFKE